MKKLFALLMAAMMVIALLPTIVSAEGDVVTIDFMIENRAEGELEGFKKTLIEPFEAEHPNIKINMIPTADLMNVVRVQLSAGQGADLVIVDGPTVAKELFDAGRLLDLTPYFEKYGWSDIIADWAEGTVKGDGVYYAIPAEVEAMWLWYNPDLFEELGLKVPTNVEELYAVSKASVDAGYIAQSFGNGSTVTDIDHWLSIAYNLYAGADDLKAALRGEKKWTDDTLKGSIQAFNDYWQAGYINDRQSYAISNDDANTLFYTGMATMKACGSWFYGMALSNCEVNYDVALFPMLRDDVPYALPMGIGCSYTINAACSEKEADACAEFINFMLTRKDLHIQQVVEYGLNPLPIDLPMELFPEDTDHRLLFMMDALNDAQMNLDNSGLVLWTFFPQELRQWQIDNMDKVFLGEMTVDEFCEGSQEVYERCAAAGTVPAIP